MIFMQQLQYNAPNRMYIFQKIFRGMTPRTLLVLWPRTAISKILAAYLR